MKMKYTVSAVAVLIAAGTQNAQADVTLPTMFGDNMVLQQNAPIRLWGHAEPGEKVSVSWVKVTGDGNTDRLPSKAVETTTGSDGKCNVTLAPVKAGSNPLNLVVQGKNTLTLKNVLVGEVWLCTGQSNMEWVLRNAFEGEKAVATAINPQIRLFHVKKVRSDKPLEDVQATWMECTPENVATFSAVGYYFARDLAKSRNVPIGLIESDWGGTPAESWTPEETLQGDVALSPLITNYPAARERLDKVLADYPAQVEKAKAEGKKAPNRPNLWRYSELYNGMLAPLAPLSVKGAIWYQGESNTGRAEQYRTLLPAMIRSWREKFHNPNLVFLIAQLAPFSAGNKDATSYAELREAQEYTTYVLPKTGRVVITDVGEENDIHPRHKEPVGERLALLARDVAYGEKIDGQSPRVKKFEAGKTPNTLLVTFENVGGGLVTRGGEISKNTVEDGKLLGFEIAGADGVFVPAEARIVDKDRVEVSATSVTAPKAVRYGFRNFVLVNLFSKEGLPAAPFRSDAPPSVAAALMGK